MNRLLLFVVLLILACTLPLGSMAQTGATSPSYKVGWDNYKPSDVFSTGIKAVLDMGFIPKDTLNIVSVSSTIDSSDVGPTVISSSPPFKKVSKVWSAVLKANKSMTFTSGTANKRRELYPFVGIEEWVFGNDEDAQRCINMLHTGFIGTTPINLRRPPREFARVSNRIYYFYTFPTDFYPTLVKVREVFLKNVPNVDLVK